MLGNIADRGDAEADRLLSSRAGGGAFQPGSAVYGIGVSATSDTAVTSLDNAEISGNLYEMKLGVLSKNEPKQIRTAVLSDNAPFMPSSRCQLDRWTGL